MKPTRLDRLPAQLRQELRKARRERGWSQLELGRRIGIPQGHVSGIETGKVVPRFDTLLDLVRVLDRDLILVPRALVPAVQALARDYQEGREARLEAGTRPLYAAEESEGEPDGR